MRLKKGPGTLQLLYNEARLDQETRRGLGWMLRANVCGNMHGIICGGGTAAMVGLAVQLGAGDMELGLLVAIPQIAALLQIPFSVLVNKTHKRKIYILTLGLFSRLLWMVFGLLPLLQHLPSDRLPLYTLISLLGIASCCGAVINVTWFPWFSDLAPMRIRGRWLSHRDMLISFIALGFGLLVAWLLDALGAESRYTVIFLLGGALGVMDMLCFGFIREKHVPKPAETHIVGSLKKVLKDKPFMRVVCMWTVWCFTANMSGAYLTPYAMNVMGLSFLDITLFGTVAASLATVIMVPRWGRALDSFGSRSVMMIAAVGASLTQLFYLLSVPGSIWPTLLHNLIGAFFWCGSNLAANSMQLYNSPDAERSTYIALFSCVTCLFGAALGTLCGGVLLEAFRTSNLFTGYFDRYKALILLSVILRFASVFILVPGIRNENEETPLSLLRSLKYSRQRLRFRKIRKL